MQKNSASNKNPDTLALFDFDGTVTYKDSLGDFLTFLLGRWRYIIGLLTLSPLLAAYKIGLISGTFAKEKLLAYFIKDWDATHFLEIAREYSLEKADRIIRLKAMERIRWHKEQGHLVVVVTASPECYLKEWCYSNGLDLIGTKLEIKDGKLTGKFSSGNCTGKQKPLRIKEKYDLWTYNEIYAYGDSKNDNEMLMLADHRFYKVFR